MLLTFHASRLDEALGALKQPSGWSMKQLAKFCHREFETELEVNISVWVTAGALNLC